MSLPPKARLLIVDDEEEIAQMLASFLKEEGYETLTALDGEAALQLIEASKPDLILLDLNIPKLSGFQILERIKPKETGIKVLIFSGVATKEDTERALSLGATAFLNKPVQIDALLQVLRELPDT